MAASIQLILGGSRSGKSRRAQEIARGSSCPVVFVATCATAGLDPEMTARVARHRQDRPADWTTVEDRFDLAGLVRGAPAGHLLLVDCLTLWLAYFFGSPGTDLDPGGFGGGAAGVPSTDPASGRDEEEILARLDQALAAARAGDRDLILVSNELGSGLVPASPAGRGFRDLCGRANQLAARHATRVELVVAGLSLLLKGPGRDGGREP